MLVGSSIVILRPSFCTAGPAKAHSTLSCASARRPCIGGGAKRENARRSRLHRQIILVIPQSLFFRLLKGVRKRSPDFTLGQRYFSPAQEDCCHPIYSDTCVGR